MRFQGLAHASSKALIITEIGQAWSPLVKFLPRFPAMKYHLPSGERRTENLYLRFSISFELAAALVMTLMF